MPNLLTQRLLLVPFAVDLAEAALRDRNEVARLLAVTVPEDWPDPDFADLLPLLAADLQANPSHALLSRLIVLQSEYVLIGALGFKGPPNLDGDIELGYGVLPAFQGHGYATEAAHALVAWAFSHLDVRRVTAECLADNRPSARVLEKLGMRCLGQVEDLLSWELQKHDWRDNT